MNKWQPINTVPRDGTRVLGYCDGDYWAIEFFWEDECEGKLYFKHWNGDYTSDPDEPTHWMPLPKPPKGAGQ